MCKRISSFLFIPLLELLLCTAISGGEIPDANVDDQKASIVRHGIQFAWIPAGKCKLGSAPRFAPRLSVLPERRRHVETLGFYIAVFEITQEQWEAIMQEPFERVLVRQEEKDSPKIERHLDPKKPVYCVKPDDVGKFVATLNQIEHRVNNTSQWTFSIPSEDEWEYAARAGQTTWFIGGSILYPTNAVFSYDPLPGAADKLPPKWFSDLQKVPSGSGPCQVGTRSIPNQYGLYDIHGNVNELTSTRARVTIDDLPGARKVPGIGEPSFWVVKGGGWMAGMECCAFGSSSYCGPGLGNITTGFRILARVQETK